MNLKSKLFGIGAAAVLSLGVMSGAMAQSSDGVSVSAELKSIPCSVVINESTGSFGTWTWNGSSYVSGASSTTVSLTGSVTAGSATGTCNVNIQFDGLHGTSGNIGLSNFNGTLMGLGGGSLAPYATQIAAGVQIPDLNGDQTGSLTLNEVPDDFAPGTYSGTVNVSTGATQG